MKLKLFASLIIFIFALTASCNSQSGVVNVADTTPQPSIAYLPSLTSTIDITDTPSPTLSPAEATDAALDALYISMNQTQDHFIHTEVPTTLEARGAICDDGFVLELPIDTWVRSTNDWTLFTCSPVSDNANNQWTPGIIDYGTRYTRVIRTDLSQSWTIRHSTFDYSLMDRPDALMVPYRWTADGKYLYLYPIFYPAPSGFRISEALHTLIYDLYRLNLQTGKFELVLDKSLFAALALSPDERSLIYSERANPDSIHIINLENGDDIHVELNVDIVSAGRFVWNSEGTKVVFALAYGKESDDWQDDVSSTSIVVLTLPNLHIQTIFTQDSRLFVPSYVGCGDEIWLDLNTICLISLSNEYPDQYSLNIESGQLLNISTPTPDVQVTPTGTP